MWRIFFICCFMAQLLKFIVNYYILLHPLNGLFSRTTWVSWHQTGKPFWISMKQEIMGGSGISWIICKSFALRSRQIPHQHLITKFFYRPNALPVTQPTATKHWVLFPDSDLLLQYLYFVPFPRYYHFSKCKWLPATLRSLSHLTLKFK